MFADAYDRPSSSQDRPFVRPDRLRAGETLPWTPQWAPHTRRGRSPCGTTLGGRPSGGEGLCASMTSGCRRDDGGGPVDDEIHEAVGHRQAPTLRRAWGGADEGGVAEGATSAPKLGSSARSHRAHDGRKMHGAPFRSRMRSTPAGEEWRTRASVRRPSSAPSRGRRCPRVAGPWPRVRRGRERSTEDGSGASSDARRIQRASASGSRASVDNGSGAASTASPETSATTDRRAWRRRCTHPKMRRMPEMCRWRFRDRRMRPRGPGASTLGRRPRVKLRSGVRTFYQSSTRTESRAPAGHWVNIRELRRIRRAIHARRG